MARKKVPPAFMRVVAEHRNRLHNVLIRGAARDIETLYKSANSELGTKLRKLVRGGKGDTMTAYQHRVLLAQVRQGQMMTSRRMAQRMAPLSKTAQMQSLKGLVSDVSRLSQTFTGSELTLPIDEAAQLADVANIRTPTLLRMHEASMARYGANVVQDVGEGLALSLLTGETPNEAIDKVQDIIDGEWWQGERIVRSEMSYASNSALFDGMTESAKELPQLKLRWEEHCNDAGEPMDNRVAIDSIALHGQVTEPGGWFTMPADAPFPDAKGETEVPDRLVGLSWQFPPNRPNDRSVLMPWAKDWGVPGWRYNDGDREWLNT